MHDADETCNDEEFLLRYRSRRPGMRGILLGETSEWQGEEWVLLHYEALCEANVVSDNGREDTGESTDFAPTVVNHVKPKLYHRESCERTLQRPQTC